MSKVDKPMDLQNPDKSQKDHSADQSNLLNEGNKHHKKEVIPNLEDFEVLKEEVVRLETNRQELVRSRNILRSLFDNLPDSVYVIDKDYKIDAVNMALSRRIDKPPQSMFGKICFQALYEQDYPCENCRIMETLHQGIVTKRSRLKRGSVREFSEWEINSYPIYDEKGEVSQIILVESDVTERHRMEMMVNQSEKMAAVGQLAAGFAHEINNPLTVIMANTQILMRELPADKDWLELLQRISYAAGRSLEIVRNLLDFAHWENIDFEPTDVNQTIIKALDLIQHASIDPKTEIIFQPTQDLPVISASASNLQSVWVNLIMNALDAVETGQGKIVISTSQEKNEILVIISDNGHGIPNKRLNRIFDPFYTTKDPGKGTGLGLSICHRTLKQHRGQIEVNSVEGKGSVFTVHLPVFPPDYTQPA